MRANTDYLRDCAGVLADEDAGEAVDDMDLAIASMTLGLEQVAWIGEALAPGGEPREPHAVDVASAAAEAVKRGGEGRDVRLHVAAGASTLARSSAAVARVIEVMIRNATHHARRGAVRVEVDADDANVRVRVADEGVALAPALSASAFQLGAQRSLKGDPAGRYGRFAGLHACHAAVAASGGTLTAGGEDGSAWFELSLERAPA